MIQAIACAKINLSLRVGATGSGGLHALRGIFQSVGLVDQLQVDLAGDEDSLGPIDGRGGAETVIDGWDNLAWQAVAATRRSAGSDRPIHLGLDKNIPVAAGLGGGSADAAAALAAGGRIFGAAAGGLHELAVGLGSDVPFCLKGGTALVGGTGGEISSLEPAGGFAVALVVPPIELATGDVYRRWDELGEPQGPAVKGRDLPPGLRRFDELVNDLYPAAVAVAPALDDWRNELVQRWARPVLLTGSGPTLFGFFVDQAEAAAALGSTPRGARAEAAVVPVPFGWALRLDEDTVEASTALTPGVGELIQSLASDWT